MQRAIDETNRRRTIQEAYNKEHNITPQTVQKAIRHGIDVELKARRTARELVAQSEELYDVNETLRMLEEEMLTAANNLEFEKAAEIRDKIQSLKKKIEATGDGAAREAAEVSAEGDLTAAISTSMSNRIAGTRADERPAMTPQQKKVRRGPKRNRGN
jgi:excinuclease UvrABC nuclease subunit